MDKKYLTYTLDELIEDKKCIVWVLKGLHKNEWEQLISGNPEFRKKVLRAREIILLLRDTYEVLEEDEVVKLWQHIEHFDSLHHKKVKNIKLRKGISWAAVIFILFSFGSLTYFYLNNRNEEYRFAENTVLSGTHDTKLILSTGEKIRLKNDNSKITVNDNEKLLINNDSIIDLQQKNIDKETVGTMNEVVIPYGKKSELVLADGTKIWLNAGSKLAFPAKFTQKTREVYLEGEAYFEVTKNQNQPFIVNTAELSITVLGTRFNVSAYSTNNHIQTVLLEGSVSISNTTTFGFGRDKIILKPNQKGHFDKQSKKVVVSNDPDAEHYIAWIEGWFYFSQQNLKNVFAKLERYYNVEVVFADNFYFDEVITGKLDLKESLNKVMLVLEDVANIDYNIRNKTIHIDKKNKKLPMRN